MCTYRIIVYPTCECQKDTELVSVCDDDGRPGHVVDVLGDSRVDPESVCPTHRGNPRAEGERDSAESDDEATVSDYPSDLEPCFVNGVTDSGEEGDEEGDEEFGEGSGEDAAEESDREADEPSQVNEGPFMGYSESR